MILLTALAALLWLVLVCLVALMPFPQHKPYAIALLCLFPVLLFQILKAFGLIWGVPFFLAAASLYRKPLGYYLRRLWGAEP